MKFGAGVGAFVNNQMATLCLVHVGEDDREAKEIGGPEGQWFVNKANDIYRPWYEQGVNVPESYRFSVSQRGRTDRQQATMEDHLRSGRFAMGDPDSVIKVMKRYADAGVDQVLCFMQMGNLPHSRVAMTACTRQKYGRLGSTSGQPPRGKCGRLGLRTDLMSASPLPLTGN